MLATTSLSLLRPAITPGPNQLWYDLGAGTGVFTMALAELLGDHARIIAVDVDAKAMKQIPERAGMTTITRRTADFASYSFEESPDGILLANALHFVKDKLSLMKRLRETLKQDGTLLIVEYEMTKANPWVPYPIGFEGLETLGKEAGFSSVTKLATADSRYQKGGMYSASLKP